ncbi:neurotransmitter-gated ion-channel ligand binding domain-containing protein [Phthorimaea operculella]|nr:neurotransmitter-gated ion-channel ligand binding domain-containing protein [Phthorimaea operculella]
MALITCILLMLLAPFKKTYCEKCPPNKYVQINYEEKLINCEQVETVPSTLDSDGPVEVNLLFKQLSFSFDDAKDEIMVELLLSYIWTDKGLTWKPVDYDGIETVTILSHEMCTTIPFLKHHDSRTNGVNDYEIGSFFCELNYHGRVSCHQIATYKSLCFTNLTNWPFDAQQCIFYFGFWDCKNTTVLFRYKLVEDIRKDLYDAYNSAGWHIYNSQIVNNENPNETYQISLILNLKRVAEDLASTIFLPIFLSCVLTVMSLTLNLDNNRLMLCCLSLLIHFRTLLDVRLAWAPKVLVGPLTLTLTRWEIEKSNTGEENADAEWFDLASLLNHFCLCLFVLVYLVLLVIYLPRNTHKRLGEHINIEVSKKKEAVSSFFIPNHITLFIRIIPNHITLFNFVSSGNPCKTLLGVLLINFTVEQVEIFMPSSSTVEQIVEEAEYQNARMSNRRKTNCQTVKAVDVKMPNYHLRETHK